MTTRDPEKGHDRLATRISIILTRLFLGEKLSITALAEEFNVSPRTLRRDFNFRLTYLDIQQRNGVYSLAAHHLRQRSEKDIRAFARLLHLDRLLPSVDAKLLNLLLEGGHPSPYRILLPEPRTKPALFGDFSRLTMAILNKNRVRVATRNGTSSQIHPYRLLCHHGEWYLAGRQPYGVFVVALADIRLVELLPRQTFETDASLLALIEQHDFIEALPHMGLFRQIMNYRTKNGKRP